MAAMMTTPGDANRHREVTEAVHRHDSKILMQILHSGRYGYHPFNVSASAKKAPIGWFTPKALSAAQIEQTIDDFVRCASLAEEAGCTHSALERAAVPRPLLGAGCWALSAGRRGAGVWGAGWGACWVLSIVGAAC
jgi:hypothetical protein